MRNNKGDPQAHGRIPRDVQRIVQTMTNWQRNQWAREGYKLERAADWAVQREQAPRRFS